MAFLCSINIQMHIHVLLIRSVLSAHLVQCGLISKLVLGKLPLRRSHSASLAVCHTARTQISSSHFLLSEWENHLADARQHCFLPANFNSFSSFCVPLKQWVTMLCPAETRLALIWASRMLVNKGVWVYSTH